MLIYAITGESLPDRSAEFPVTAEEAGYRENTRPVNHGTAF
jgi:hypothetical protein